jgi:hypothetical protein
VKGQSAMVKGQRVQRKGQSVMVKFVLTFYILDVAFDVFRALSGVISAVTAHLGGCALNPKRHF